MKTTSTVFNKNAVNGFQDGISEIKDYPTTILQEFFRHEYLFIMGLIPSHCDSDETPPLKLDLKSGIIPIDGFLGKYEPGNRQITIFAKAIEEASLLLRRSAKSLYTTDPDELQRCLWYVVKYHQYSHAMVHLSVKTADYNRIIAKVDSDGLQAYRTQLLKSNTALYSSIDPRLNECMASLLSYFILRKRHSKTRISEWFKKATIVFEELNRRQPTDFNVDSYLNDSYLKYQESKTRFISAFGLIKEGMLAPDFDAWDSIMKM